MLTAIKERASGWIAWTLVALISIPFALWGINSYFEGASKIVVATVNGVEIEKTDYQNSPFTSASIKHLIGFSFEPNPKD